MTKDIKDKSFDELTKEDSKKLKIEFAPGCFDNFEGSQQELDELMEEINQMFASGEAFEKARKIDFEDPDEDDLEAIERILEITEKQEGRKLQ